MLFFDIDSYNSFHCLPFTHDVNTKEKHILLKYGCEFPHSRIYLISTTHFHWFLNCCFIVGVTFDGLCHFFHGIYGNITGRHLADAIRRCSEGLADYNLEFIFCSLTEYRIIIPHGCSWRRASRGSLSGLMDRSKETETDTSADLHHTTSMIGLSLVSVSNFSVLALILQRYYP